MFKTKTSQSLLVAIFFHVALLLVYIFFHLTSSYSPGDDGFILAHSWSFINGKIPYKDFIYHMPFLSVLIHSVWFIFPDNLQFILARLSFFLFVFIPCVFTFYTSYKIKLIKINSVSIFLSLLFTVFSFHIYAPMPFYTSDGFFLSAMGLNLLVLFFHLLKEKTSLVLLFSSGVFCGLAPLAKTNFVLVAFLYFIAVISMLLFSESLKRRSSGLKLKVFITALLSCFLPALGFLLYLFSHDLYEVFLSQSKQNTSIEHLLKLVVYPYFNLRASLVNTAIAGIISSLLINSPFGSKRVLKSILALLLILFVFTRFAFGSHGILFHARYEYMQGIGVSLLWFVITFFITRLVLSVHYRKKFPLMYFLLGGGVIVISWLTSVSWAWANPLLGFGPLFFILFPDKFEVKHLNGIYKSVIIICFAISIILSSYGFLTHFYNYTHSGVSKAKASHDIGAVFSKFGKLKVQKKLYDEAVELKDITRKYVEDLKPFVVLPNFPLAYFLTGVINPIPIDWWWGEEYLGLDDYLLKKLIDSKSHIIVQKRKLDDGTYRCEYSGVNRLVQRIIVKSKLEKNLDHYCLYYPL